jgi:hypothetical protein
LIFFKDTFRKERSLTYQAILKKRLNEKAKAHEESQEKDNLPSSVRSEIPEERVTLRDVSPFRPIYLVLRRWNNVAMLLVNGEIMPAGRFCTHTNSFVEGIMFSWQMMITYTIARSLSIHYHYNPWKIGLTSLAYGLGRC